MSRTFPCSWREQGQGAAAHCFACSSCAEKRPFQSTPPPLPDLSVDFVSKGGDMNASKKQKHTESDSVDQDETQTQANVYALSTRERNNLESLIRNGVLCRLSDELAPRLTEAAETQNDLLLFRLLFQCFQTALENLNAHCNRLREDHKDASQKLEKLQTAYSVLLNESIRDRAILDSLGVTRVKRETSRMDSILAMIEQAGGWSELSNAVSFARAFSQGHASPYPIGVDVPVAHAVEVDKAADLSKLADEL